MTDKQIIIDGVDVSGCSYHYKHTRVCLVKMDAAGRYYNCANWHDCDFKKLSQQLKAKEQECERLESELNKTFEEKDKLHLIIDRLLEASGYDTNTASAEDFEDVYEHMRYEQQQLDQLKAENEEYIKDIEYLKTIIKDFTQEVVKLKQTLTEIKEIAEKRNYLDYNECLDDILQKISECEVENGNI